MSNLETHEILDILQSNCELYYEWNEYICEHLDTSQGCPTELLARIEDASIIRDLYFDFFESPFNQRVNNDYIFQSNY